LGGDLLFSIVGYVGLTAEVPDELEGANITQTTARLSIDPTKADSTYVFHFLSSPHYRPEITRYEKGSAQPGLNLSDVQKLKIRHPKLPQQRRIATILTTLDEAIEATEKLVEKHQQIKAGLMHDLFTRGLWTQAELDRGDHKGLPSEALARAGSLRPTPEEALGLYQETEIGLFPKAWKIDLLDAFAKRGSGHTPNRHNPAYWNGGVKWVSLADSFRLDQLYISETDKEISQLGIENSSAVLHPPGIVVLSRDAGVGKSAITTCPMAVSQHFMCWLCGPELDNHYLYYWLQDQKRVFENISTGTTIPTIGLGFFRRYKIAIPSSPEEQQQIRSSLLSCDESLFALQDDLAKLRQQKQGLMHDLLTGRVRVEC
jgi:type I restriction enzyme S subunit